jgi:hypothetical protein
MLVESFTAKSRISIKESMNILGLPWKNSLIAGGRDSFIPMIEKRPRRRSSEQWKLESHITQ